MRQTEIDFGAKMNWKSISDEEVLKIATPIMDNLMHAATEVDYERHVQDFSLETKQELTKDNFEAMCKGYQEKWGDFSERELVGIFRKTANVRIVWRQWCTKSDDEFIASLHLFEKEGRVQIVDVGVS